MFSSARFAFLCGLGGWLAAIASTPAHADPHTQWQERHRDLAFLAGRWIDPISGNELTLQGNRVVLSKKRGNHYRDTPIGFALVTNISFNKVSRSNQFSVQYEFTATCNQYRANGSHFTYSANQFLVMVNTSTKEGMLEAFTSLGSTCLLKLERPQVLMPLSAAASQPAVPVGADDPGVVEEFLALVQGGWVSRHQNDDSAVEVAGSQVRLVRGKAVRSDLRNTPRAGDTVAIIDAVKRWGQYKSPVTGEIRNRYLYIFRGMTHNGQTWQIADQPMTGYLNNYTFTKEGPGNRQIPIFDYRMLSGSNSFLSEMWRPDDKARIFGNAPLPVTAPVRGNVKPSTRPAVTRPQPLLPTVPPESVPVTTAQAQAELVKLEQLNREQAAFAAKQVSDNIAAQETFDRATRDREATIARQEAEYRAALAAQRAQEEQRQREHEAAMGQWRADVAACQAGDKKRCAQPPSPR